MLAAELPLWEAFFAERFGHATNADGGRVRRTGDRLVIGGTDGVLRGPAIGRYLETLAAAAGGAHG